MRALFYCAGLFVKCFIPLATIAAEQPDAELYKIITSKAVAIEQVRAAIANLQKSDESPGIWVSIANDEEYVIEHRRVAIIELFRRHVRPGMTLAEMQKVVNPAKWLHTNDVVALTVVGGHIPVKINEHDTVFVIRIFPDAARGAAAAYLRVSGNISASTFATALKGETRKPSIPQTILQEIALVEH